MEKWGTCLLPHNAHQQQVIDDLSFYESEQKGWFSLALVTPTPLIHQETISILSSSLQISLTTLSNDTSLSFSTLKAVWEEELDRMFTSSSSPCLPFCVVIVPHVNAPYIPLLDIFLSPLNSGIWKNQLLSVLMIFDIQIAKDRMKQQQHRYENEEWTEIVEEHWKHEGPEFTVDAIIGRINQGLFVHEIEQNDDCAQKILMGVTTKKKHNVVSKWKWYIAVIVYVAIMFLCWMGGCFTNLFGTKQRIPIDSGKPTIYKPVRQNTFQRKSTPRKSKSKSLSRKNNTTSGPRRQSMRLQMKQADTC